jgi:hypothetical protein
MKSLDQHMGDFRVSPNPGKPFRGYVYRFDSASNSGGAPITFIDGVICLVEFGLSMSEH